MEKSLLSSNLLILRKKKNLNQEQVANNIGTKRTTITNYEAGISSPDHEKLIQLSKFFDVSIDDLLIKDLSKPKAYKAANTVNSNVAEDKQNYSNVISIPLIPFDAMAGYGTGDSQLNVLDADKYIIPEFQNKADFLIRISGTSMNPKYFHGDIVACKKIPLNTFIQWGKVYIMDTEQGPLCKRLLPSKREGYVQVVSDNAKLYPPFEMNVREQIRSLGMVVGVIRLE